MTTLYKTKATALAGRNGNVATEDGLLNVDLSYPKEMGGSGTATNPEQLFAAGYAACFSNAILHVAKEAKVKIAQAPVSAEVGIGPNAEGGFELSVELAVSLDLPQDNALELVRVAHKVCPYSNATRGNIDVAVTVNGEAI
ncbi:osmotically inducible protein C [Vibrio sp. MACH09]|uniref:organic hydroperoxide resistance protein n=1 Tax=unclassified Vibrio TaxID=2614977 RepID=UPI0014932B04|nr:MULTISPECIES: organic hydroperoxide resistance protein [unclassified Vibrio]NOI67883.1 organic hydroperoxide resistance protein [Vibrio sp. 99-8-1]GLO62786.1 osmotically inducible protein C [Vibrio sp. MACH09]